MQTTSAMYKSLDVFNLAGRVALVTGGGTGIGKCIARGLAGAGAAVVIASRTTDTLQAAVQEIIEETGNSRVAYLQADLSRREETRGLVRRTVEQFGRLDILVGNAAFDTLEPLETYQDSTIDTVLETNLVSNIVLLQAAIPELRKHGVGRAIFVSSIAAEGGSTMGVTVYAAAKAGLGAVARNAAFELGPDQITVNCLAPGFTLTPMLQRVFQMMGPTGEQELKIAAKTTAMNRWVRPEELVGPVLMLASDAGSAITGQVLIVDGGTTIRMK